MKKPSRVFPKIISGEKPDFVTWSFPVIGFLILSLIFILFTQKGFKAFDKITFTGSVIALFAAFISFLAFWVHLRSNREQETVEENSIEEEVSVDLFNNRFNELIRLHQTNVSAININNRLHGRKTFVSLFREYKFCYHVLQNIYASQLIINSEQSELNESDLMNISYLCFYMGVADNTIHLATSLLGQYDKSLIDAYVEALKNFQKSHNEEGHISVLEMDEQYSIRLRYKPFCGHMARLEHYYRHLFHIVKYVVSQHHISQKLKYEYIKILRTQISDHEQMMLYYNSLTAMGKPWLENGYLTDFRLIKNIPLPLADFGITPKDKFGEINTKGETLFEWDEIVFRNKIYHPARRTKIAEKIKIG